MAARSIRLQKVFQLMDLFSTIGLILVIATGAWVYRKLSERVTLLEHEVRWLRQELEESKPTEVKSVYDRA